jgi:hypothetical protein
MKWRNSVKAKSIGVKYHNGISISGISKQQWRNGMLKIWHQHQKKYQLKMKISIGENGEEMAK